MRAAVIDMGTNTFNLLVLETDSQEILYATKIPVGLGQGGFLQNELTADAMERGMEALRQFKSEAENWQVRQVYTMATSAVRNAHNQKFFTQQIKDELGFPVNVISGNEEARLIYQGVRRAMEIKPSPQLIIDIGGGSTEFILANESRSLWMGSFDLGSSRLREIFNPSDPITEKELKEQEAYLQKALEPLWEACTEFPPMGLIGSSGSFETLAVMVEAAKGNPPQLPPGSSYSFDLAEYQQMAQRMISYTLEQRLATPGMVEMRAPLMGLVCILINLVLEKLDLHHMRLSEYALKEGVFQSIKENDQAWQKSLL